MRATMRENSWRVRLMLMLTVLLLAFGVAKTEASAAKTTVVRSTVTISRGKTYRIKPKGTSAVVAWKSGNSRIVRTLSGGRITGMQKGTAVLTGKYGKKTYICTVKVMQPATKVTLSKTSLSLNVGKSYKLTAKLSPSTVSSRKVSISTSNRKVAAINSGGYVKGVAAGTATITVKTKDGSNKKATCRVKVTKPAANAKPPVSAGSKPAAESKPAAGSKQNAERFVALLKSYDQKLQQSIREGNVWTYSNSGTENTFGAALKPGGKKKVNCALLVSWGLRDMGILGNNGNIWYGVDGQFHWTSKAEKEVRAKCQFIPAGKKTAQALANSGALQPGDIVCWNNLQHMNVYAGNSRWFDGGRSGGNGHSGKGGYIFERFTTPGYMERKVDWILRVK